MSVRSVELRQKRKANIEEARKMLNKMDADKRAAAEAGKEFKITAEDEQRHARLLDDADRFLRDAEAEERQEQAELTLGSAVDTVIGDAHGRELRNDELADIQERIQPPSRFNFRDFPRVVERRADGGMRYTRQEIERRAAFTSYLLGGIASLNVQQRALMTPGSKPNPLELRAYQADNMTSGGYMVVPMSFLAEVIQGVNDDVFIRGLSRGFTLNAAASMGCPSMTADASDSDWTVELKTGDEETTLAIGRRDMYPHPLAKLVKLSQTLARVGALSFESFAVERIRYKLGVTQEKAYMTGTGAAKPLGVFTASNDGIPTSRDYSTDNTTTGFTADGLIGCLYNLKGQYQRRATWAFHRDAVKKLALLKDGMGQFLWGQGLRAGQEDTLCNRPLKQSEFAPNTFTTGLYVGIVGDFSYYWYVDALTLQIQRLIELYAVTNQIGLLFRYEGDGAPVLAEAFSRVKLA